MSDRYLPIKGAQEDFETTPSRANWWAWRIAYDNAVEAWHKAGEELAALAPPAAPSLEEFDA